MRNPSTFIVDALKCCCEADRVIYKLLDASGLKRRFHGAKGQDRWVVQRIFKERRHGFFVEIGAADGRTHSNTYILERDYEWTGIAVEANPRYFAALRNNRKCTCVSLCVDAAPGEIEFYCNGFLGGIVDDDTDNNRANRGALFDMRRDRLIKMNTTSLHQLLESQAAPTIIDYLSLDVEGAEYRILSTFPFEKFSFECLTVERPTRAIHNLLLEAGYVLDRIRKWDGFYVSKSQAIRLGINKHRFEGMPRKFF
jgi:FkbM family methyltransferase